MSNRNDHSLQYPRFISGSPEDLLCQAIRLLDAADEMVAAAHATQALEALVASRAARSR